ncbi:MAG TPA: LysR family transcriptional regulator substrate-binding protein, partial [Chthoniobacteraceae bacterium]|nr:LysR family transcriptional regulator substrate-binding protein [Chthoniobacteraceae bacterium]
THACAGEPVRFCLGAGDSLIQWLLLPGLGKLQREFPRVIFRINGMGTREIVSGLQEMSLDFGILRRDAVPRGLKCKAAGEMKFALYVPGPFLHGKKAPALGWALENLPIATQSGDGRFSKGLHGIAAKLGVRLNIVLECQTFTQALCVLRGGGHAAILPQLAGRDLDPSHFATITSPHFQSQARQIAVAWNPRTIHVREMADRLCRSLLEHYRF